MTVRNIIILLLLTGLSGITHAGKAYKWIDENGATQYSQKPPPKSVNTSSEVDVSQHANIMKPEKRGKDYYCGDYRLSKVQGNPARIITRLQENLINWQREKDQQYERRLNVTKQMNQAINRQLDQRIRNNGRNYSSSSSSSYTDRHKKELRRYDRAIAQIDCKIKWNQAKLEEYADEKKTIAAKYESSRNMLNDLQEQKIATCGVDNREGVIVVDDQYRAYQRCSRQFDRQIKQLQRTSKKAERDYESIQGW